MISLRLGDRTEQFRREFSLWLKDNSPPSISPHASLDEYVRRTNEWQEMLAAGRWVAVHWPEQYGGRGLTIVEEAVGQECLAAVGAPQLVGIFGLTMVGPVLIKHGTDAQKKRFLQKILTGEEIWCQGFSEPEAGSDLASLRTIATQTADNHWQISGQKVWTGFAQYADWCFMLVRTDGGVAKHKGLSYLLVPMKTAGVDVRPIRQITGEGEFNEVFLNDVRVPNENLVGKPGEGWSIAIATLMYERAVLTFARHLQSEHALRDVKRSMKKIGASKLMSQFGRLVARQTAIRMMGLSHLVAYDAEHQPGPEGSLDKLAWSEAFQDICKFDLAVQGQNAVYTAGSADGDGTSQYRYLYSRGRTIAAGTSEIQRNIIAERILGLPRAS